MTHAQNIALLTAAEDWPALLRYRMAWLHTEAFVAAHNIVKTRRSITELPWASLSDFLDRVGNEMLEPRHLEAWMLEFRAQKEAFLSLLILVHYPLSLNCKVEFVDLDPEPTVAQAKVDAARLGAGYAKEVGDHSLVAALMEIAETFHHDLGEADHCLDASSAALLARRLTIAETPGSEILLNALADRLKGHSFILTNGGCRKEAVQAAREEVDIRRRLMALNQTASRLADYANALNNLANGLSEAGFPDEALIAAIETVRSFDTLVKADRTKYLPELAMSLHNLANRFSEDKQPDPALRSALEAVSIRRELIRINSKLYLPKLALSLLNLSNRQWEAGHREESLKTSREAIAKYRGLAAENPKYKHHLAAVLNNFSARLSLSDNEKSSYNDLMEAVLIRREMADTDRIKHAGDFAIALSNLAGFQASTGRTKAALEAYAEASGLLRENGQHTRIALARCGLLVNQRLAELFRTVNNTLNLPDYSRAQEALVEGRRWAGIYRRSWRSAVRRQELLGGMIDIYALSVRNAVDVSENSGDSNLRALALSEAIAAAEESRAQSLAERLLEEDLEPRSAPPGMAEEFRAARRQLRSAMANWERETGHAWSGPESPGAAGARLLLPAPMAQASPAPAPGAREAEPAAWRAARAEAEAAQVHHDALLATLQRHDPDYSPDGVPPVASVEAIRAALPPGSVALSFVLTNEETIVLLTSAERMEAVRVPAFPYRKAAQWARDWLGSYFSRPDRLPGETREAWQARATQHLADWQGRIPEQLSALEEKLLPPVVARLEQMAREGVRVERLVICPHVHLHLVPWAACRVGGQYLADRWEISTVPSLSMLVRCRKRPRPAGHALHVVNPTADLAFADAEHAALRRHYPQSRTLHRGEATREAVLAAAPEAWFFYYTGHMTFHPGEPLRGTAAVLAQGTRPATAGKSALREAPGTDEQGKFLAPSHWLTLADVFAHMNLSRCGLLIANGCESHMLHPNVTDDAESLVTGFLFAGAAAVIGTHWAVWDLSAALLMDKFHQLWNGGTGLPVAAALREAARWLREDIRTGRQLVEEIVPTFLEGVTDAKTLELCRSAAATHAMRYPDTPPFAAPGHWAAFTASGAV